MTARPGKRLDDPSGSDAAVPSARASVGVRGLRCSAVLLTGLLVFPGGSAWGDVASQALPVSATVLPHARLIETSPDTTLTVAPADIERGYVDVQQRYWLRTNAPDRVAVQIHPRVGLAEAVDIAGFDGAVRLAESSIEVSAPVGRELDVSFRVWLRPGVTPGAYPLPLHLAAVLR